MEELFLHKDTYNDMIPKEIPNLIVFSIENEFQKNYYISSVL